MRVVPGRTWIWARRIAQCAALLALLGAPLLGGWQRLDRAEMALWDDTGWSLPKPVETLLPLGDRPDQAYEALVLVGGGDAAAYADIPAVDPVVGVTAALRSQLSGRVLVALAIPIVLALVAGRIFCGWLCPFGVLARFMDALLRRLPWYRRRLAIPRWRPLRYVLLGASIGAGMLGVPLLAFLLLPHLLVQQSVYAMWLLGGGGAILGVLLGLMAAGLVFGPTVYCASLCPTGAALSLLGRKKLVRVTLAEPDACGRHCELCDNACWLQLHPASGDPGPDCDSCARCFRICPHHNLAVASPGAVRRKRLPILDPRTTLGAVLLGCVGSLLGGGVGVAEAAPMGKPRLLLRGEVERGGVTVALTIVDESDTVLDPDERQRRDGVELSAYMSRGREEFYQGPLEVRIGDRSVDFVQPTSPLSTPTRSIYRRFLPIRPTPGTIVTIEPVPGWLDDGMRWTIPSAGVAGSWRSTAVAALGAGLLFGGLMCLALAVGPSAHPTDPGQTHGAAQ
ncbi:4Fe-4S binding protein [Haliangium sp.]|uniref:4Fe-4S binding protein n=1 Tax=Haliangium sp. TaxID=2663208 RepID=UPI003D107621